MDHENLLFEMHSDPRVMATLAVVKSREKNREWVEEKVDHWDRHGIGLFCFFDRNDAFVGRGGLLHIEIDGQDHVELNYSIVSANWGQGYATEASGRLLKAGFDQVGLADIIALTLETNLGSQRVMQKLGFVFQRKFDHLGHPSVLYQRNRSSQP